MVTHPSQAVDGGVPDWVPDAVLYQIFPERYANGDFGLNPEDMAPWGSQPTATSFFGGDIQGIRDHLNHLIDLGVNALYLTPIFEARTNHRYDTSDYTRLDPLLGSKEVFREFVQDAHALNIRILLDAVFHHCGDGHWAFRDVVENGEDSAYVNWFYVQDFPVIQEPEPNYETCSGCAYLPKLNVHNPAVRKYLWDVTKEWTAEGIDGWRLDVPFMMNHHFWRQFRKVVKPIDTNLYILAEVWDRATDWVQGDQADGATNYRLRDLVLRFLVEKELDASEFAQGLAILDQEIPAIARYAMVNLVGSHDTPRILTLCKGETAGVKLAQAMIFSSVGVPLIYYGDEIGMEGGDDPDCRRCMIWDRGFWNHDLLTWMKALVRLRKEHVALRRGSDEIVLANGNLFIRKRSYAGEVMFVAFNRGTQAVEWRLTRNAPSVLVDAITGERIPATAPLMLQPRSARFLLAEHWTENQGQGSTA